MKFLKILSIYIITILTFPLIFSGLMAQSGIDPYDIERVGLSGWQFLKITGNARHAAMGGAITATANGDASAIFCNPASLADVKNFDISLNQVNWIADIGYQSSAIVKNFNGIGVFGLSVVSIDMGDMAETINSPISGTDLTEAVITGNTFTAGDIAVGLSYARAITDRLSIGGNLRFIRENIAEVSMTNLCLDIGTLYYTGFRSLRLAMTMRNFGPDAHLVGWSEEIGAEPVDILMPIDFRIGLAMDFFESGNDPHFLTLSIDGCHPNDSPEKINVGAEYVFNNILSLRTGYRINYDEESLTFGGGLSYFVSGIAARINYAYVDFGKLKFVHMFSLGFAF